jgi:glycerophosphoryl diester phosphodiesterase
MRARTMGAALGLVGAAITAVTALNSSSLAPERGPRRFVAHRGVHQTFEMDGVDGQTCTARQVRPITHRLIENTLPSIRAAFDAGAQAVEVDVHGTADGHLVLFHDAGLECRTDGHGAPEDRLLSELRSLDLGHGYTSDGGVSWPLRGSGRGMLITLPELLAAEPGRAFVIDVKTNRPEHGELLAGVLADLSDVERARHIVYGGPDALEVVRERLPDVRTFDRGQLKSCLLGYAATGWFGRVPEACARTWVLVPVDKAGWLWGFPRRFEARMAAVGSEVVLIGPMHGSHSTGIDDLETLAGVPEDFGGWIWTNRVEVTARR